MSNSIYTYRLSYLTFRDPSRARRGPPLQVLEEKIRYSSHVTVARSQMEQFHLSIIVLDSESIIQLPSRCHALLDKPVSSEGFFERVGDGTQVPASSSRTWALPSAWEMCVEIFMIRELSLNASWIERLRNYSYVAFFAREESDAFNFEICCEF